MMPSIRTCGLLGSLLAAGTMAGPVAVRSSDIEVLPAIQERTPSLALGSYSLETTHESDVLFNIGVGATAANVGDLVHLEVVCVDCRTWGTAVVSTSGVSKDESIIGDIIEFFENPVDAILSAFDLDVKIEFEEVGGHFEFEILAADTVSYSIPIFESDTIAGIAVSEEVSVGLVLAIDLVFSLTAEIDLDAGFEFSFPEGAYITVDPLDGHIVDQSFTGGEVDHIPITVTSGSATFKAALRVRIQAGTTVEVFGTGFDFELGIFADLIEYVATIGTSDTCELYITESVDVNIGAFARAVVEIDYHSFGVSPTVVTTLLDIPLPSLCLTRPVGSLPTDPSATTTLIGSTAAVSDTYPTSSYPAGSYPGIPYPTGSASASGSAIASESYSASYSASYPGVPYPTGSASASGSAVASGSYPASYPGYPASYPAYPASYPAYPASYPAYPVSYPASGSISASGSATASGSLTIVTSYTASGSAAATYPVSSSASSSGAVSFPNSTTYGSSTITSAASLTTSTVYTTDLITITKCAATVLHCPASLTSEIVITSTKVLYTTICPVGQVQPTVVPSASATSKAHPAHTASTIIISPIPLTPYATPVVSTVYTTTFVTPTYTIPTATSFTVPYPNWNATSTTVEVTESTLPALVAGVSTVTVAPVYATTAPVKIVSAGNSTVLATGTVGSVKVQPTAPANFTGAAGKSFGMASGAFGALAVTFFLLL